MDDMAGGIYLDNEFILFGNLRFGIMAMLSAFLLIGSLVYEILKKKKYSIYSIIIISIMSIALFIFSCFIIWQKLIINDDTIEFRTIFYTKLININKIDYFWRISAQSSSYNYNFMMIDGRIIKLDTQWLWGENLLKDRLIDRYNLQYRDM